MNLSHVTILFLALFFQETLFSAMADRQFIENTCKSTPSYNLCLSILLANPKSQNADLTGLALFVVDAVKNKGVKTLQQIDSLKKSMPELTPTLMQCGDVYKIVVGVDVPLTINALNLGNPKFGEDGMADTTIESQACERSFQEHGQTSPLTNMNKDMEDVANVARAIIRMLL
ncbi:cell wall / vacuolar inhibitor of fructosidase 1 [Lactuca sativa]|uniref:cell wall / vacuolar inhibitor of fructosidase 1 n=1 Tax=Lactuca sativa TaxID=4236 RepID=UPI0022AEF274|nr:cell wall / vacuolar inhibitor of fructosidase 1 [Lactuca sativa]